jgi:hypothetical protein
MTRAKEIQTSGFSVRFKDTAGKIADTFTGIKFYMVQNNIITLFDMELKIVADVSLKDFPVFDLLTVNV